MIQQLPFPVSLLKTYLVFQRFISANPSCPYRSSTGSFNGQPARGFKQSKRFVGWHPKDSAARHGVPQATPQRDKHPIHHQSSAVPLNPIDSNFPPRLGHSTAYQGMLCPRALKALPKLNMFHLTHWVHRAEGNQGWVRGRASLKTIMSARMILQRLHRLLPGAFFYV